VPRDHPASMTRAKGSRRRIRPQPDTSSEQSTTALLLRNPGGADVDARSPSDRARRVRPQVSRAHRAPPAVPRAFRSRARSSPTSFGPFVTSGWAALRSPARGAMPVTAATGARRRAGGRPAAGAALSRHRSAARR
jgi:hypothetical protein